MLCLNPNCGKDGADLLVVSLGNIPVGYVDEDETSPDYWGEPNYDDSSITVGTMCQEGCGQITYEAGARLEVLLGLFGRVEESQETGKLRVVIDEDLFLPPEVEADPLIGKTILAVDSTSVDGEWGDEPATRLTFTDGTTHVFVHPKDDD